MFGNKSLPREEKYRVAGRQQPSKGTPHLKKRRIEAV